MNLFSHLSLAGILSIALSACSRQPTQQAAAPPAPQVTVAHARLATVTDWDEYPGHLDAVDAVDLKSQVSGYLESIHFQDGAEVKAGDLLCVIDPRPYQAALDQAEADVKRAETRLALAESELKRAEALRGTKAISEEELDTRANAVRDATAALNWSKAGEATARLNLSFTRITAPISGRIGRHLISTGSLVEKSGPNSTVLAKLVSLDPIYCYFDADERAFLRYRGAGEMAQSSAAMKRPVPCEVGLANEDGFPHRGRLDFFNNEVDTKTGTIQMRAVFENGDRTLVPGLFARVRVPAEQSVQTLLIPDAAIGSDQGRKFVYVINAQSMVEMRPIQTGRLHGTDRAVASGMTTNESVVINGLVMLRPGMKVQTQAPAAATQAAGVAAATH